MYDSSLLIIQDKGVKIMFGADKKALFARYLKKGKSQYCNWLSSDWTI